MHTCVSRFKRIAWDGLIVLPLLLYLSVIIPYRICFVNEPEPYTALHTIDVCVEVAFLLDIIINFRTGYFIEGIGDDSVAGVPIEYHPKSVAGNYIRTWFSLDAVSAIPFACIELLAAGTQTEGSSMLKILKSLRMLRFLKIARPGQRHQVGNRVGMRHVTYFAGRTGTAVQMLLLSPGISVSVR